MSKTRGMPSERWRELRNTKPRFRWAQDADGKPLGPTTTNRSRARKGRGQAKHTRVGPQRTGAGLVLDRGNPSWHQTRTPNDELAIRHTTKREPWVTRAANRRRNRAARATRQATR